MTELIFYKQYDGESIVDMERDIYEVINGADIPLDQYGFPAGTFTVKLEWKES